MTLEASSQAGVQARLRYLPLAGLAFLNLSPEHAELHPCYEDYRRAKASLFAEAAAVNPELVVVVPRGDLDGEIMASQAGARARVIEFGEGAEVSGKVLEAGLDFLHLELCALGRGVRPRLGFGGLFNLQNALAAAALAVGAGLDLDQVAAGLEGLGAVRGRFEVLTHLGVAAMVDYAHSASALEQLLLSCRPLVPKGRLLLVFGCGGKKDSGKRPRMGASAAEYADLSWITNDNPRGEDPAKIAGEIHKGMPVGARGRARIQLDRRAAIQEALAEACAGDLVVVAGKGHETVQDLGDRVIEFDDLREIQRIWAEE
jgi:UDP-N-acetylmuramoyl-L-alanyl-D-glutamate--2,6-diaminopimelate ligase